MTLFARKRAAQLRDENVFALTNGRAKFRRFLKESSLETTPLIGQSNVAPSTISLANETKTKFPHRDKSQKASERSSERQRRHAKRQNFIWQISTSTL